MTIYRVTPLSGVPCLRHGASIAKVTARAIVEFPAGLQTVEPVGVRELAVLVAHGAPVPVEGRRAVEVYNAVQRERARAAARIAKSREAARAKVQQKRADELARKAELKAQERASRAAEKKRAARAVQRPEKAAAAEQAAVVPVMPLSDVQGISTRPPWEE